MIPRVEDEENELAPSISIDELELMAYLDGELDSTQIASVEARLKVDAGFAARLRGLEAVTGFVQQDADRIYETCGAHSIVDDVMTRIAAEAEEDTSLPSAADLELMAYLDGELDGQSAALVEARLKNDLGYSAKLRGLEAVSSFVRDDSSRIYGSSTHADSIADAVMARIAAEKKTVPNNVVPFRRESRESRELRAAVAVPAPRQRRTVVFVAFGTLVAAAAAIFVFVRVQAVTNNDTARTTAPTHKTEPTPAPAETPAPTDNPIAIAPPATAEPSGKAPSEVLSTDVGRNAGELQIVDVGRNSTVFTDEGAPSTLYIDDKADTDEETEK